jgi:rubrerythrin
MTKKKRKGNDWVVYRCTKCGEVKERYCNAKKCLSCKGRLEKVV